MNKVNETKLNFFCGTPIYMSPEIVTKKEYIGGTSDIWALGVTLYQMGCLELPFKSNKMMELREQIGT